MPVRPRRPPPAWAVTPARWTGTSSQRADVQRAVAACVAHAGRLDVMVASAGIADVRPLLDVTDEQWQRVFDVNVTGVFLRTQEAARAMAGRGGSIVVTASTNAIQVEENLVSYSASKGAVVTFVRAAALDLARHGIRINAVAPGVVNTRIAQWIIEDPVRGPEYLKKIPLRRFAEPDDVARLVGFRLPTPATSPGRRWCWTAGRRWHLA